MVVDIKSERPSMIPDVTPYLIGEWEENVLYIYIYIFTLLLRSDKYEVNHDRPRYLTLSRYSRDSIMW